MKIYLRVILPIVFAVAVIIACIVYLAHDSSINADEYNVMYNDIVYEQVEKSYNIQINEENAWYSGGDYSVILDYGQERLFDVYVLNGEENILYSQICVWVKPGYELPGDFGEEFASVDYVVPDGLNFLILPDAYTEEVTPLEVFNDTVKLEDIVAAEPSDVTEYHVYDYIRFNYKHHKDISLYYDLCEADGKYYLNVRQGDEGTDALHEIKAEYIELLTSAIPSGK